MTTDVTLVKVKTMTKSMAKQIQVVKLDWKEGSPFRKIRAALEADTVRPLGWTPGMNLGCSDEVDFWLIEFEGRLWWFMTNNVGTAKLEFDVNKVPQIFV